MAFVWVAHRIEPSNAMHDASKSPIAKMQSFDSSTSNPLLAPVSRSTDQWRSRLVVSTQHTAVPPDM